ncbi:MAG: DegT/DnrJ/EryC1/StrS family aminotransferase, partial [Pseudomonadota bacterium]
AVLVAGATPVFVDIDPHTLNISPDDLERRIGEAKSAGLTPRAICAVDLFGVPADYPALGAIADAHGMRLWADGAQSFGGRQGGKWVANIVPVTGVSFFPGKALGAYGDGGATFTNDDEVAEWCTSIRWHGTDEAKANSVRVGINGRMATFQAAVLLEKNAIFWDELEARKKVAATYDARLGNIADLQAIPADTESGYGYYTIQINNRDAVREKMSEIGVPTAVYYMTPLHHMPAFEDFAPAGGMPNAENASQRVLSLPMHPYLTEEQTDFVCEALVASHAAA